MLRRAKDARRVVMPAEAVARMAADSAAPVGRIAAAGTARRVS